MDLGQFCGCKCSLMLISETAGSGHPSIISMEIYLRVFSRLQVVLYPRDDETVLHVLPSCDRYAEARNVLRKAAGDRWDDGLYLLEGWSGRRVARTGKSIDGPHESWKPVLKVIEVFFRLLYQTGRRPRPSDMRVG